jgi:hypothetical protein
VQEAKAASALNHWREQPPPRSEWIEFKPPIADYWTWHPAPAANFIYFRRGSKFMAIHFDPKSRSFGAPFEVNLAKGSTPAFDVCGVFVIRGPGVVFQHQTTTSSVWLMKLPE